MAEQHQLAGTPNTAASWLPGDAADDVRLVTVVWPDGSEEQFLPEFAEALAAQGTVEIATQDEDRLSEWRRAIDARNLRDLAEATWGYVAKPRCNKAQPIRRVTPTRQARRVRPAAVCRQRTTRATRDGPDEPEPARGRPLAELQQAQWLSAAAYEVARNAGDRVFDTFLDIEAIRVAHEQAKRWWDAS